MPVGDQAQSLPGLLETEDRTNGDDEIAVGGETNKIGAHRIPEICALRLAAAEGEEPIVGRAPWRGDRDDPRTVGDEIE